MFLCQDFRLGFLVEEDLPEERLTRDRVHLVVRLQLEERRLVVKLGPLAPTNVWVHRHVVEVHEAEVVLLAVFLHGHQLNVFHAVALEQVIEHMRDLAHRDKAHQVGDAKRRNRHVTDCMNLSLRI